MNISKIDKNFEVKTAIQKDDIQFHTIDEPPFGVFGIFKENGKYRRMPEAVAKSVSDGVYALHTNTAGGRVRFITDSSYIAINARMDNIGRMPHFTLAGSAGFDLYIDNVHKKTFVPPYDMEDGFEGLADFAAKEFREITINFPLYSNVKELYIGLEQDAIIKEAPAYRNKKPVVYYGSSITQGGCASRPGMCYQNIISRRLNCDYINLGFSGNALAEDAIAEYIKKLDMSVFVYDYDHNAPTEEHLQATHEKMFKEIRKENPELPFIMMSRPKHDLFASEQRRLAIIEKTYNNAIASGDKNVYLINNSMLTRLCGDDGTVDGCHPTDFGFSSIAQALGDVIERIDFE